MFVLIMNQRLCATFMVYLIHLCYNSAYFPKASPDADDSIVLRLRLIRSSALRFLGRNIKPVIPVAQLRIRDLGPPRTLRSGLVLLRHLNLSRSNPISSRLGGVDIRSVARRRGQGRGIRFGRIVRPDGLDLLCVCGNGAVRVGIFENVSFFCDFLAYVEQGGFDVAQFDFALVDVLEEVVVFLDFGLVVLGRGWGAIETFLQR